MLMAEYVRGEGANVTASADGARRAAADGTEAAPTGGEPAQKSPRPPELTGREYWFNWGFAIALVVLFVVACAVLLQLVDNEGVDEIRWHRYVYIFSAFASVVFTAVGWLFGREVHRSTAERAITDAKHARQEAKSATTQANHEAMKGRHLAEAIKASVVAIGGVDGIADASSNNKEVAAAQLIRLKQIADERYP